MAEISFVLKAVATLVMSLKKAPPGKGIIICFCVTEIKLYL